ncbi:MAG: hypothetical protein A4E37_01268 [Methanoregulaceae archaeon PtaB.Bin056]|jgi:hypothetical protein|nr:MAG: hypothetical protein A4E37_01268 [Methanoregulaceae archaeon PtaB.Bin056]
MSGPRTLTIGITVNLEHYENLRLEVNGEVKDQEDARDLARFLSDVLGTYGRGDPATAERIESFRRRVLPPDGERRDPVSETPGKGDEPALAGAAPCPTPAPACETTAPPPASRSPPSPLSAAEKGPAAGAFICEECAAPVNQAEQKMSMLFASRVLCRKCLKKV